MKRKMIICSMFIILYADCINKVYTKQQKSWRDKDIRDMTDADLEHLLDEWEKNDDPLEPDELPEHLRPSPQIDISKLDASDPDSILKMTKKGKGVMMFVDANENLPEDQADVVMRIWQTSLQNNHIIAERYPIDLRRSIFMFREGSQAVDAKNYLLEQPEVSHVTLEGQTFYRDKEKQKPAVSKSAKNSGGKKMDTKKEEL